MKFERSKFENLVNTSRENYFCVVLLITTMASPLVTMNAYAAKCIEDPDGIKNYFKVALNSVINDQGELIVDRSRNENAPPLHWKYKSIKLIWPKYTGDDFAGYQLNRFDYKKSSSDDVAYATSSNAAEPIIRDQNTVSAIRPNHASLYRSWNLRVIRTDGTRSHWINTYTIICGQFISKVRALLNAELRTQKATTSDWSAVESDGSEPQPLVFPYSRGKFIHHPDWNPNVKSILAARRAAKLAAASITTPTTQQANTPSTVPPTSAPPNVEEEESNVEEEESNAQEEKSNAQKEELITPPALTATMSDFPSFHNWQSFSFTLTFSEDVSGLSYKTLASSAFLVKHGRVEGARRVVGGSNERWSIQVRPYSNRSVEIELSATTDCTARGGICSTDGRMLTSILRHVVPGVQASTSSSSVLKASFSKVPADHNGTAAVRFNLNFSENVTDLSYRTLRDVSFTVVGGRVAYAQRLKRSSNQHWVITVMPSSRGEMQVILPATTDCAASGAICINGSPLSNANRALIRFRGQ